MKRLTPAALLVACALISALFSSCALGKPDKISGQPEEGKLLVWLGPVMSSIYSEKTDTSNWPLIISTYTDFSSDVTFVPFETQKEFDEALSYNIQKGRAPDLIIAGVNEISYKQLKSGVFTDLFPYLEYEYSREGGIKRENILTPDFKGLTVNGKLFMLPLDFDLEAMEYSYSKGQQADKPSKTPKSLISIFENVDAETGGDTSFVYPLKLFDSFTLYKNFIDYDTGSTRMKEEGVYENFIKYVNILKRFAKRDKDSKTTDEKFKTMIYALSRSMWGSRYNVSSAYHLAPTEMNERWARARDEGIETVTIPCFREGDDSKYLVKNDYIALIPANSQKPLKAFRYIMTVYGKDFNIIESLSQIPLNKQMINASIDGCMYYTEAEKEGMYESIVSSDYKYRWEDSTVYNWYWDLVLGAVINDKTPSKEEWNQLSDKIKIYIGE